jgi:hypothetical protein
MPDKPPGLKEVVESAQTKLKNELEAAANTFAEFSVIGLKHILGHPMFENTLKTLGLQVIPETPPQPAKPRKTTAQPAAPKPKATAPEADKTAFLAAATKLCAGGKSERLTKVAKAAKLTEDKAKAAKAALIADGKLKDSGAWVVLPD